jgi:hypothetical protein
MSKVKGTGDLVLCARRNKTQCHVFQFQYCLVLKNTKYVFQMEQMLSDKASDLESSTSGSLSDMSSLDSAISCKLDCDRSNCCCQVNKDQSEGSELPNNDSSGCCKKTASQSGCNEDVDKSCGTNSAGNAVALEKLSVFNRKIDKAVIDF